MFDTAPRMPMVPTGVLTMAPPSVWLVRAPTKRKTPLVSDATTLASPVSGL